jgi:hypothetical protein
MLIAPDFQEQIADAIQAPECSVLAGPNKVVSVFVMPTASPLDEVAGRFSKQIGEFEWLTDLVDNRRRGRVTIRIERFPVHFAGNVTLYQENGMTVVDYDCDLHLNVPSLEAATERAVAERSADVIGFNQELGEAWLRDHGIEDPEP